MEVVDEAEEPVDDRNGGIGLPSPHRLAVDDKDRLVELPLMVDWLQWKMESSFVSRGLSCNTTR